MLMKFYGHSDDCFEMETDDGRREETYGNWFKITDKSGNGLVVWAEYGPCGNHVCPSSWMIGVSQLDENVELPWPVSIVDRPGYTVELRIDYPGNTWDLEIDRKECSWG